MCPKRTTNTAPIQETMVCGKHIALYHAVPIVCWAQCLKHKTQALGEGGPRHRLAVWCSWFVSHQRCVSGPRLKGADRCGESRGLWQRHHRCSARLQKGTAGSHSVYMCVRGGGFSVCKQLRRQRFGDAENGNRMEWKHKGLKILIKKRSVNPQCHSRENRSHNEIKSCGNKENKDNLPMQLVSCQAASCWEQHNVVFNRKKIKWIWNVVFYTC